MTAPAFILPAIKNNLTTKQLLGALGAADTTVVLKSGHGASFPTIYTGGCSSTGSGILLNDTGALGSVAVGDFIENLTDGSWAIVTSISGAPDSIATTPLEGGSDNTWQSGDVWCINAFIVTFVQYDVDGTTVLKRERAKCTNRVTDTLTVVRGYDSDSTQTFEADDYVQLLIEKSQMENLQKAVRNIFQKEYVDATAIAANRVIAQKESEQWFTATGTNTLTGSLSPAITAYTNGLTVRFVVANSNTGAVTLNLNGLGAKDIKRLNGTTALATGDLIAGQLVELTYDGTNFQMMTPQGTTAGADPAVAVFTNYTISADIGVSTTAEESIASTHQYTVPANTPAVGTVYEFCFRGLYEIGTGMDMNIALWFKGIDIGRKSNEGAAGATDMPWEIKGFIHFTVVGASGFFNSIVQHCVKHTVTTPFVTWKARTAIDTTASDMTFIIKADPDTSNAAHYVNCHHVMIRKIN